MNAMTPRCAICSRVLFKTAYQVGVELIGPKCFKVNFGKLPKSSKVKRVDLKLSKPERQDDKTIDMFEGEE